MKVLLLICLMFCGVYLAYEVTRPVEHFNVKVVVESGDTLHDIICELQREYGDRRDWREVHHELRKLNGITRFILPGQEIVVPLEVRK